MNVIFLAAAGLWAASSPAVTSAGYGPQPNYEGETPVYRTATALTDAGREAAFFDASSPRYDSLLTVWHELNSTLAFDNLFDNFVDIDPDDRITPAVADSIYEARLKMIISPISMPYNPIVRKYIESYTGRNKGTMCRILGRAQYYFPIFEHELDKAGLPLELKILPVVESALAPDVRSSAGAMGLWQFMLATGKRYGLEVTSFVDQRCDPVASTKAAIAFLSDLYNMYDDWILALAAYNCGPGNVTKALKRAGADAKSFWDIYPYLPKETRGYVPSFIACTYAYHYHRQHGIVPECAPVPLAVDTVHIKQPMHFKQISSTINTPVNVIRDLNPQYTRDIVPAVGGKVYTLTLPMGDVGRYVENEAAIRAKDVTYLSEYLKPSNLDPNKKEFSLESYTYRVKSGDNLSSIAQRNGVSVKQIIKWNNLKNPDNLKIGQRLEIYR